MLVVEAIMSTVLVMLMTSYTFGIVEGYTNFENPSGLVSQTTTMFINNIVQLILAAAMLNTIA